MSKLANKTLLLICFISLVGKTTMAQSPSFSTFMTLVLPGDHPDPTLTRIGNDFYTSGSSFARSPIIYHSTDLVHWQALSNPLKGSNNHFNGTNTSVGAWGGNFVYFSSSYWYFVGNKGKMYFVKANQAEGPWSDPVQMICPESVPGLGMDNSIFIDDDVNKTPYLLVKNGQANNWILELGSNGQPTGKVLDLTWINPAPAYRFGYAEGPVMWKNNGYYYYSFAINAGGGQKLMRSRTLVADETAWEIIGDFYNESDSRKADAIFTGPNHCSQVMKLDDDTSWVLGQSTTDVTEWKGSGRQGILTQVKYNATTGIPVSNYPINEPMTAPRLPSSGIPFMVPHTDRFNSPTLQSEWSTLGYTPNPVYSLTQRVGWLRLFSNNTHNTLLKADAEHNYSLITKLDLDAKVSTTQAGLNILAGNQVMGVRLYSTLNAVGSKVIKFSFESLVYEVPNTAGSVVWLKMERVNHSIIGYFSANGSIWTTVGQPIDVSLLDKQAVSSNGWIGNSQGIFVKGSSADFDLYIYRDAYSPILAECPANQFGTYKTAAVNGLSHLGQIHHNDWALYAGVEFGNADYTKKAFQFEATVSAMNSLGKIEVWLDSIATGTKIADCPITSSGSYTTFKTYVASVNTITGMHDVYLRFVGTGTEELFVLKSFRFIDTSLSLNTIGAMEKKSNLNNLMIYPNPLLKQFSIQSDDEFSRVRILQLNGQVLEDYNLTSAVKKVSYPFNHPSGTYILEVTYNNKGREYRKMIVL
jgi:xylan 1,4-beta-xylosidase